MPRLLRRLPAYLAASALAAAALTGCSSEADAPSAAASASATPTTVAIDLTFDDGTAGVVQITTAAADSTDVSVQVALPDVVATAMTASLTAPDVEPADLGLTEGTGGVWSGTASLVPGSWDLTVEVTRDDGGFLATTSATTTFDLPLQEQ